VLSDIAASGNRLQTLQALRDHLAFTSDNCRSSRDIAALSRQLTAVLAAIDALPTDHHGELTPVDQLFA